MKAVLRRFIQVVITPDAFFEGLTTADEGWWPPLRHLLILAAWLSVGSVIAWGLGIPGDTPINSSLGAQMEVYAYWHDTLLPGFGLWSYPLAVGLIVVMMLAITAIFTPLLYVFFRFVGRSREPRGLLRAFQGFVYGLTPCALGGFLPILGLLTGVYATILQLHTGPATTMKVRGLAAYIPVIILLGAAIAQYWQGNLL